MTTDDAENLTQPAAPTTAANGEYTSNGLPNGLSALIPFLAIPQAKQALVFYQEVFGARLVSATEMGGILAHAELDFGHGHLQLGEPDAGYHLIAAPEGEDDCYSLGLYCQDTDELVARAQQAGATIREAPSNFVSGDRFASIRDPFGVRWSIMTRVEDLSEQESTRRVEEWAASFSQS